MEYKKNPGNQIDSKKPSSNQMDSQKNLKNLFPVSLTSSEQAYTGYIYLSQAKYRELSKMNSNREPIYITLKKFVFLVGSNSSLDDAQISMGNIQRQFLAVSKADQIEISVYTIPEDKEYRLSHLSFEVELYQSTSSKIEADDKELESIVRKSLKNIFFTPGQINLLDYNGCALLLKVSKTLLLDIGSVKQNSTVNQPGILVDETDLELTAKPTAAFKIKSSKGNAINIFRPDFEFKEMGIGGLDKELMNIFRRAFASRRFPPSVLARYGISHVKGLLLYGPPGTGKTLIARQLAKALRSKEPKIVNGPEIMNKYVGETEKNIRDLFQDAKTDMQMLGEDSQLHIIIFDEIDAICKSRGTVNSGTGVHDSMVNQLLSMIDGVDALNNILVIGMTNRKDLLDEAILRPGRFEVHIEVGLPDEHGRQEIFAIHTKTMTKNNLLASDVNLDKLAKLTKNYTGAEIESVVKSAASFFINKNFNILDFNKPLVNGPTDKKIDNADFMQALDEVKPQFGADTDKFEVFLRNDLIDYGPNFKKTLNLLKQSIVQVVKGKSSQLHSILLEGDSGCGKTALASWVALNCDFPYVKLISPENFVGYTETGKINAIVKIFDDAYRSSMACIVLDNIERLIEFVDIGPRFSNALLQVLLVLIKKVPKYTENKLMVIGTTSFGKVLKELEVVGSFNIVINVPLLKRNEEILQVLLKYPGKMDDKKRIAADIKDISVKKLLLIVDMACQGDGEITYDGFMNCYEAIINSSNI